MAAWRLRIERMYAILICMGAVEHTGFEDEICTLAAQIHAATARLAGLIAEQDRSLRWAEAGARSCAHWLTIATGFDLRSSNELVRVGHALEQLPKIAEAFNEGRLSFDKVRAVTRVAIADDEAMWLDVALQASGSQLARICRAVRSALDVNDPRRADDELARRGVHWWWRDDGMLQLLAVLPREDGAVVVAALESVSKNLIAERDVARRRDSVGVPEPLRQPILRADALVRVCEQDVSRSAEEPLVAPTRQMVVHVDSSVLRTGDEGGRCHIEDGPWLSARAARWLACDADVVTVTERDGLPIDVGRASRVIPPRLRLALHARDKGCRYPGCGVPAKRAEGHHLRHWPDGGRTELRNLILLCRFHHRRHHEGKFEICVLSEHGHFAFERPDSTPIVVPARNDPVEPLERAAWMTPDTPIAAARGERCNFEYAVSVLADASGQAP